LATANFVFSPDRLLCTVVNQKLHALLKCRIHTLLKDLSIVLTKYYTEFVSYWRLIRLPRTITWTLLSSLLKNTT